MSNTCIIASLDAVRLCYASFRVLKWCCLSLMFDWRQCATNQYLRRKADPHRYCRGACANHTRCGPVIVPEKHLQVLWATSMLLSFCSAIGCGNYWKHWCCSLCIGDHSQAMLSVSDCTATAAYVCWLWARTLWLLWETEGANFGTSSFASPSS